jgi:hypothetical protein
MNTAVQIQEVRIKLDVQVFLRRWNQIMFGTGISMMVLH